MPSLRDLLRRWLGRPRPPKPEPIPESFYRPVAIITVPGATVRLDPVGEAVTNQDGYYCWPEVSSEVGETHLWVTADPAVYEPYDSTVVLSTGQGATGHDIFVSATRPDGPQRTDIYLEDLKKVPVVTPIVKGLQGAIRIQDGSFADDTGPVNPVLCHAGDLIAHWVNGRREQVRAILDDIAKAGYHGVRTWTVLGPHPYWSGYFCGPHVQADYFQQVAEFAAELKARGLYWLVSQGDMLRAYPETARRVEFMQNLANTLKDTGIVFGVDGANEALWNGEGDPERIKPVVDAYRRIHPVEVWSLTSAATEEVADLNATDGSVFDVHGSRDGNWWDKIRHIFSIVYEGGPDKRLGIQSEPFGPGELVSVTANKHELTTPVECLAACQSLLSRQAWVYFSGPGVKSDQRERLQDMPGFWETPAAASILPKDVARFAKVIHGGATWRGQRVWAVTTNDHTRADHALSNDGRFVCILYGPSWRSCVKEREYETIEDRTFGEHGRVIVGKLV